MIVHLGYALVSDTLSRSLISAQLPQLKFEQSVLAYHCTKCTICCRAGCFCLHRVEVPAIAKIKVAAAIFR